jgi:hypothetical protein
MREREKGCGTHLRGSRDPAWVLASAWSPWWLSVSRRHGRRLGRDPGDLRVTNGTDRGRRRSRVTTWRRWWAVRRWLRLTTRLARVWDVGGVYSTVNFIIIAVGPHLLLYGAGRQGPTSHLGWAPPIRARLWGQGLTRIRWGLGQQEIKLTVSPLISLCTFLFLYIYFFLASS